MFDLAGKTVVVTGAAGFIGSAFAKRALAEGATVYAVDCRFITPEVIPVDTNLVRRKCRVEDGGCGETILGADYVFHAAVVNMTIAQNNVPDSFDTNVAGTVSVLSAAREGNVKRVVYPGSVSIYRPSPDPLTEDSPKKCATNYAASKLAAEAYCEAFGEMMEDDSIVRLRYSNVYGPGQDPKRAGAGVVARFFDLARNGDPPEVCGNGSQSRDFTYIDDVVDATLLAMTADLPNENPVYNVATCCPTKIWDLAEMIAEMYDLHPAKIGMRDIDTFHKRTVSAEKIWRELDWQPKVDIREGLQRTKEWFERGCA